MLAHPLFQPCGLHAASSSLLLNTGRFASLFHTARSLTHQYTLRTPTICPSHPTHLSTVNTRTSALFSASTFQAHRNRSFPSQHDLLVTRCYTSLATSLRRFPLLQSRSAAAGCPCVIVFVPRRSQHQQQARGRGDNTAIFQLIVVGLRFVARTLPFLWRNERVQAFYRAHPKSVLFLIIIPAVAIAVFLVSHASFVPYSNRLHFTFLGPASEQSLSLQAYQEVIASERERLLPPNDPTVQQVKRVAEGILRVAVQDGVVDGRNMGEWQVNVIESNVANAFVLPSGQIFVYDRLNTHTRRPHQSTTTSAPVCHTLTMSLLAVVSLSL